MPAGKEKWQDHLRWLQPGLGVKRWLLPLAFGAVLLSMGGADLVRASYPVPSYFYYLTLQFLPRLVRALLLLILGVSSVGLGLWGLNRALLKPFVENTPPRQLLEALYDYRRRGRGPKIVVIGGGHGQATLLRGLKAYTSNLTAIVTVADDGGSSGRLRRDLGILPPGDFRNCIAALSDDEALITRLLQYRFAVGAGLEGHNFGNLFLSALADITGGFESALKESSRVLAVQGRVLPCTLQAVVLMADVQPPGQTPVRVRGESQIRPSGGRILRVALEPSAPLAYGEAIRAILEAELIVAGPGSLYTSVLPNLLVPEITAAVRASRARKVYVCNVATECGETDHFTAEDHLQALEQHLGLGLFSAVVINEERPAIPLPAGVDWVAPVLQERPGLHVVRADLTDPQCPWRHHSAKLAQVVVGLLKQ